MKNANQVLAGFSGTEYWYKYPLPGCTFTDGVQFIAREYGAYWLIDLVFSYQCKPALRKEFFQVWELTCISGDAFNVTCDDGDGMEIQRQYIRSVTFLSTRSSFTFHMDA